jgi:pimeloyl-ACP methyl ester carboxylesterase
VLAASSTLGKPVITLVKCERPVMPDTPDLHRRRSLATAAAMVAASQLGLSGRVTAMTNVMTEVEPDRAMPNGTAHVIQADSHEPVDVLGWSLGGFIAQVLPIKHPQGLRKLILAGTALVPTTPPTAP